MIRRRSITFEQHPRALQGAEHQPPVTAVTPNWPSVAEALSGTDVAPQSLSAGCATVRGDERTLGLARFYQQLLSVVEPSLENDETKIAQGPSKSHRGRLLVACQRSRDHLVATRGDHHPGMLVSIAGLALGVNAGALGERMPRGRARRARTHPAGRGRLTCHGVCGGASARSAATQPLPGIGRPSTRALVIPRSRRIAS